MIQELFHETAIRWRALWARLWLKRTAPQTHEGDTRHVERDELQVRPEIRPQSPTGEAGEIEPISEIAPQTFSVEEGASEKEEQKAERLKRGLREKIADECNALLDRLGNLSHATNDDRAGKKDSERALSCLLGSDIHLLSDTVDALPAGSRYGILSPKEGEEREFAEAVWPLDISHATYYEDGDKHHPGGAWCIRRVRTVDARTLRGQIRFVPPKIVLASNCTLYDNGQWWAESVPLGLLGNRWVELDRGMEGERWLSMTDTLSHGRTVNYDPGAASRRIALSCSLALSNRYYWYAALGFDRVGPRLLLPTSPSGCLSLFKDRAKEDGRSRRAALRHWVTKHYRDDEDFGITYVREHLRGQTEFTWRDLECELLVSEYDLEKNELFKQEASEWRSKRKHNAVRVRIKK